MTRRTGRIKSERVLQLIKDVRAFLEDDAHVVLRDPEIQPNVIRPTIFSTKQSKQVCYEIRTSSQKIPDHMMGGYSKLLSIGYDCYFIIDDNTSLKGSDLTKLKRLGIGLIKFSTNSEPQWDTIIESAYFKQTIEVDPNDREKNQSIIPNILKTLGENLKIIEKWTSKVWFDILKKELEGVCFIRDVKIVTCIGEKITGAYRRGMQSLNEKYENSFKIEVRLLNSTLCDMLHDRFIIGDHGIYSYPGIDIIYRNQHGVISKIDNLEIDFEEFWEQGMDLNSEWEAISKIKSERHQSM